MHEEEAYLRALIAAAIGANDLSKAAYLDGILRLQLLAQAAPSPLQQAADYAKEEAAYTAHMRKLRGQ